MRRTCIAIALVLGTAGSARPVAAQPAGRLTAGGSIDYARIVDDESVLGSGWGGSGSVGWRLTDATGVEVEVGRTRHVRDLAHSAVVFDAQGRFAAVPYTERWEGTATFLIGSVTHTFGAGRARPVVWGGGGLMSHDGTRRGPVAPPQVPPGFSLQPGDAVAHQDAHTSGLVADGGAGVEVRVASRLTLRPFAGIRLTNAGEIGPKYVGRAGIRIGFR